MGARIRCRSDPHDTSGNIRPDCGFVVRVNRFQLPSRVLATGAGYLLGTISSATMVARAVSRGKVDPSTQGSGNPGAMNIAHLFGNKVGAIALAGDVAKAVGAGVIGRRLAGPLGANLGATASVVGHCHPIWSGAKGGKGVATSIGHMLVTFPGYVPVDVALGAFMAKSDAWRDRKTESTGAALVLWVVLAEVWRRLRLPNLWGGPVTAATPISAAVSGAVIMHKFLTQPDMTKSDAEKTDVDQ